MKAALLESHDAPLRIVDLPDPEPAAGEVVMRIAASGVNPLDLKIAKGAAAHARQPPPAILGLDAAGTVTKVGPGVEGISVGDEVYGLIGGVGGHRGSLAEYAAVDAELLARRPANLSAREAASLPLVFITAWEGLVDRAHVSAGQKVLVHGGGGGVGHIAVQVARAFGAEVWATDSERKRGIVEGAGAHFLERGKPLEGMEFDLVYDTAGGTTLDASFQAVRRFGHVVSCLGWGTHALGPLSFRAATYSGVFTLLPLLTGESRKHHGEILTECTRLVEAGKVTPLVDPTRYTLETVAAAHRAIEEKTANGKVVVDLT